MTKLEKLYSAIKNFKELDLNLPDELIQKTNRVEEEIIREEVIPALTDAIEPIISQIQRELILVVEYVPNEALQVKMSRKRSFKASEEQEEKVIPVPETHSRKGIKVKTHSKSKWTNLLVVFPGGRKVSNSYAYQTLCEVIEIIGPERVSALGIRVSGVELVTKKKDDFYSQHPIKGGWLVMTNTSTETKKNQILDISSRLGISLEVEVQ